MHGSKLCRCHVHRFNDAPSRYAVTPRGTDALNEASFVAVRLLLNYLQRLNLSFRIFKRLRSATRLSCFNIPVEALTPPYLFQNIGCYIINAPGTQPFGIFYQIASPAIYLNPVLLKLRCDALCQGIYINIYPQIILFQKCD